MGSGRCLLTDNRAAKVDTSPGREALNPVDAQTLAGSEPGESAAQRTHRANCRHI
ncbi:hypothetical protein FTUN_8315 [Frigoriglobus tundricola]|uniref:Uncharacterized protein n=1 Tax=Frigoriglobus tundricola TaxID=2774151 RepID=A0A6M5Z626_9BACT|nr:hypothetical protein FTUN_8315 [Frigoriglobus tundricola]